MKRVFDKEPASKEKFNENNKVGYNSNPKKENNKFSCNVFSFIRKHLVLLSITLILTVVLLILNISLLITIKNYKKSIENKDKIIELISPLMRNLTKGERYNFEVELFDCDELFIVMDNTNIPMMKEGTIFKRENFFIHGNSVKISAINYIEGSTSYYYAPIYSYNTIGDDVGYT